MPDDAVVFHACDYLAARILHVIVYSPAKIPRRGGHPPVALSQILACAGMLDKGFYCWLRRPGDNVSVVTRGVCLIKI